MGSPPFATASTARARRSRSRPVGLTTNGWSLIGTHDLSELCRVLHSTISRQMDATIFLLSLYDAGSQTVEVVWQVEKGKELSGGSFPLGDGLTSQVILTGEPRLIRNWAVEGPRVSVQFSTPTPGLPKSAIAVPLLLGDEVIGLICVQSYACHAYGQEQLELIQTLAAEASIVIAGLHFSERSGAQARRRVSELEAILANMADALLTVDANGCIVRINRIARELLTLHEASIILGQPLTGQWDGWPVDGRVVAEALQPIIEHLQKTHEPQEIEVDLPGPVRRTLSFRASPIHDADEGFHGGVIVFSDVTGRREVERLKDDMFSIASHDLKTPATVIKTEAQVLQRQVRQGNHSHSTLEEGLAVITAQADRLATLINNLLLDLSRIEAGRLRLNRAPTDLRDVVCNISRAFGSTAERHTIRVDAPRAVVGLWDANRLEEVIQNLLSNAIKYSPEGGCIDVRVCEDEDNALVVVRDRGIGLAQDEASHVFERFYRGRGQDLAGVEGTGLGLYICQAIVSGHGGRIWAESAGPGRGSTFAVCLPLAGEAYAIT